MQLARFQTFVCELHERCNFPGSVTSHRVCRKFSGAWSEEAGRRIEDKSLVERLEKTFRRGNHWREENSSETFFPVLQLGSVVVTQSSSPPRKPTRDSIQEAIDNSLRHAMHEFDASHDGLTGVLLSLA